MLGKAAYAIASQIVLGAGSILTAMLLASSISADEFTSFRFYQLTVSLLVTVVGFGVGVSASKMFAQFDDTADVQPPIGLLFVSAAVLSVLAALIAILLPDWLVGNDISVSSIVLAVAVFVGAMRIVPNGGLMGLERFGIVLVLDLTALAILIIGILIAIERQSVEYAIWALLIGQSVHLLLSLLVVLRSISIEAFHRNLITFSGRSNLLSMMATIAPNAVVGLALSLQFWGVARIILSHGDDPVVFGIYVIGIQWFGLTLLVPKVINRVVFPRSAYFAGHPESVDPVERKKLARTHVLLSTAAAAVLALFGLFLSPYAIGFYGPNYEGATTAIGIFMLAGVPYAASSAIGSQLIAKGKDLAWMFLVIFQLAVTVSVCGWFISTPDLAGAIALTVGGLSTLVIGLFLAKSADVL